MSRGMSGICSGPTHYTVTFISDEMYSVLSQGCKILKDQTLSIQTVKGGLPHRDLHPAGHMTACSEETTKHRTEAFTGTHIEIGVSRDVAPHTSIPTFRRVLVPQSSGHICTGADVSEEPAVTIFKVERHTYKRLGEACSS